MILESRSETASLQHIQASHGLRSSDILKNITASVVIRKDMTFEQILEGLRELIEGLTTAEHLLLLRQTSKDNVDVMKWIGMEIFDYLGELYGNGSIVDFSYDEKYLYPIAQAGRLDIFIKFKEVDYFVPVSVDFSNGK